MSSRFRRSSHDYELLPRASLDSNEFPELERSSSASWFSRLSSTFPFALLPGIKQFSKRSDYVHLITPRRRRRTAFRLIYWALFLLPYFLLFLVVFVGTFLPSYTHRPTHYDELRQRSLDSTHPGRANTRNEKVFIAASIYEINGELTGGAWGKSVLELVDLLGPENVYLSIYENDPDPGSRKTLYEFERNVTCNATVNHESLPLSGLPRVTLPDGTTRIKRIAFLAEVRNRALLPLSDPHVPHFDRLLFVNDVIFDPVEAAQLLFSTNADSTGRAEYTAACAVDFINPFKFYDRFATRDMEGYSMGIPFFPWFTNSGDAISRKDVLANKDAVRVRSCWGGMMAFEAKWFQPTQMSGSPSPVENMTLPIRFRSEEETFWESSECCLINADLQYHRTGLGMPADSAIYMNPFVRVAYDTQTFSWLSLTRRPERLYSIVHDILNHLVGMPGFNPRRTEEPGQLVKEQVYKWEDPAGAFWGNGTRAGKWVEQERVATSGGFCGGRKLLIINEDRQEGEGKWSGMDPPQPPSS